MAERRLTQRDVIEAFRKGINGEIAPEVFDAMLASVDTTPGRVARITIPPEALDPHSDDGE